MSVDKMCRWDNFRWDVCSWDICGCSLTLHQQYMSQIRVIWLPYQLEQHLFQLTLIIECARVKVISWCHYSKFSIRNCGWLKKAFLKTEEKVKQERIK